MGTRFCSFQIKPACCLAEMVASLYMGDIHIDQLLGQRAEGLWQVPRFFLTPSSPWGYDWGSPGGSSGHCSLLEGDLVSSLFAQLPSAYRHQSSKQTQDNATQLHAIWAAILGCTLATACTSAAFPLRITTISISPEPIVGAVVQMSVEVVSTKDEPVMNVRVYPPEGVKLVGGDLEWNGSLAPDIPVQLSWDICVLYSGDWRVTVIANSFHSEGVVYTDVETVHIHSELDSAQFVMGRWYRPTQRPDRLLPTRLPDSPPPSTCP